MREKYKVKEKKKRRKTKEKSGKIYNKREERKGGKQRKNMEKF